MRQDHGQCFGRSRRGSRLPANGRGGPIRHLALLIRSYLRRCQADNPLIALSSFPGPPLPL